MRLKDLIPMLETEDLKQTIRFYTEILGFKCQGVYPDEGDPCWASLTKNEVVLMFSVKDADADVDGIILTGSLYFYPENINELWKNLKDKVPVIYPLEDFQYGMREFGIKDNNGYLLQFGQEI
jgi:uncharacterized glyoxalase superfamily protein PhnB